MTIKDMFTREFAEKYCDVDIYNDVTDGGAPAFCGALLTPEGERVFKDVLDLEVEFLPDNGLFCNRVIVKVDDPDDHVWQKYWGMAKELFYAAAGYCDDTDYDRWFKDPFDEDVPEAPAPVPKSPTETFGEVSWSEDDIITSLREADIDPTPEHIALLRNSLSEVHLKDVMIAAGWTYINYIRDGLL